MNTLTKISTALAMAFISCQTLSAAGADIPALEQAYKDAIARNDEAHEAFCRALDEVMADQAMQFLQANAAVLQPYASMDLDLGNLNTPSKAMAALNSRQTKTQQRPSSKRGATQRSNANNL